MKSVFKFSVFLAPLFLGYCQFAFAQPQGFNYQSVVRRTDGSLMKNKDMNVRVTILSGPTQSTALPVYGEVHWVTSNSFGLINLVVGNGISTGIGTFSSIPWKIDNKYIQIEVDTTSTNSNYVVIGTSQLMSVPFALYAPNSGSGSDGKNSLIRSTVVPPGPDCAAGGVKFESGLDLNLNNLLDNNEVTHTSYVCNGSEGPPGNDGKYIVGATAIAGTDSIEFTFSDGTSIIVDNARGPRGEQGLPGPPGAPGSDGLKSLVRIITISSGFNCANNGGLKIECGLDVNNNDILEPSEVTTTQYVCNGADGTSIRWLGTFSSPPSSPSLNEAYYNSTDKMSYIWDGNAWQTLAKDGEDGITSLNGQTGSSQSFRVDTVGTSPTWSSVSNVHTLSIPLAKNWGVTAGLLSKADYDLFRSKLSSTLTNGKLWIGNSSNVATEVELSGDATLSNTGQITISDNAVTFPKIQKINSGRLLGRWGPGLGNVEEITLGSGLTLSSGGVLNVNVVGFGTVTSVGLSLPSEFTVSGSPISSAGTLSASWASQPANKVFASPDGSSGAPSFRSLTSADIPNLDFSKITTGIVPISRGGTGASTLGSAGTIPKVGPSGDSLVPSKLLDNGSFVATTIPLRVYSNGTEGISLYPFSSSGNYPELRFYHSPNLNFTLKYVGFKAPDSISSSQIWTLPASDGNPGQHLTTDGAGGLYWSGPDKKCLPGMFAPPNNQGYCIDSLPSQANTFWEASNNCSINGKRLCSLGEWYNAIRNYSSDLNYTYGSMPFEWLDYSGLNSATIIKMDSSGTTPPTIGTDIFLNSHFYRCCYSR